MPRSKTPAPSYSLDNIHSVGTYGYYAGATIFMPQLMQKLLSSGLKKKIQSFYHSGVLTQDVQLLFSQLEKQGGKSVFQQGETEHVLAWDDAYVHISHDKKDSTITLSGWSLDPKKLDFFKKLEKDFITKEKKNLIYTIIKTNFGLEIKSLGNGHSPLIPDNYSTEVIEDINYVVDAFKKDPPAGRIVILNGEPGTGKTHLIRSMLSQLDCVFLIIPSNLIEALDKPEFLPLLISVKETHERPIIMIIEDGDVCLVPRRGDNISTIASLLNLSDGIIGSLIDIKIVISTNVYIDSVDAAILRPGRLCKQIHVGPLPYEQANKVYQRLLNDPNATLGQRRHYTLAEIYDRFNTRDMNAPVLHNIGKRVIGFHQVGESKTETNLVLNRKE